MKQGRARLNTRSVLIERVNTHLARKFLKCGTGKLYPANNAFLPRHHLPARHRVGRDRGQRRHVPIADILGQARTNVPENGFIG